MPQFTPPVAQQSSNHFFWGRYSIPVGQSVVRIDGTFRVTPFPWLGELVGEEGTDWFLGGHTYNVSASVAAELAAAGFDVETPAGSGFGNGPFGSGPFGGS